MSSVLTFTPLDQIPSIVQELRAATKKKIGHSVAYRRQQLLRLLELIDKESPRIVEAAHKDLRKPTFEASLAEVLLIRGEVVDAINGLAEWVKPEYPSVSLVNAGDNCQIRKDPLGLVLIIGAWNYPFQLTAGPLIGAIAAGNAVILKPSEVSPHTAQLLAELIPKYLDPNYFRVVNGAVQETSTLLDQQFDHILYTGSGNVGKIIMAAASKFLTPVTLELGGKSPTIVDETAIIPNAANRIAWGKWSNSGQTCIAPDYVLVHSSKSEELIQELGKSIKTFYGENPQASKSYARIVNRNHFNRLKRALDNSKGQVRVGGETDENDLYIAPTVVLTTTADDSLMKDEIFGPILPIVVVGGLDEAIDFINSRDKPLALYGFTTSKKAAERILSETSSGGALINDTVMHASAPELPFGGVGPSGMGAYHGRHTFELFSHKKSTMVKSAGLEFLNKIRYPPYTDDGLKLIARLTGKSVSSGFSLGIPPKYLVLLAFLLIFRTRVAAGLKAFLN